jgi:hypothetical protein
MAVSADYDPDTGTIRLRTQWQHKPLVKQIPGARWDAHEKYWRVPAAWASLVIMRGLFGSELDVQDSLKKWSWELYQSRVGPSLEARQSTELIDDGSPEAEVIKSWRT